MSSNPRQKKTRPCTPPVIVVSGAAGASGMHIVNTVLAQFPGIDVPLITVNHVREEGQLEDALLSAQNSGGILVHTLVDTGLRKALKRLAGDRGIPAIDLMGDLMEWLEDVLGVAPVCRPGLYRSLNRRSIERAEAIGFAVAHDDGQNLQDLSDAEIVLVGLSRVGKTPLSMYLAVQGWKTANVPLVSHRLPPEVNDVDKGRIIGMIMDAERLAVYRRMRREKLGLKGRSGYADLEVVFNEVEQARELFKKKGYSVIDVTDRPLETNADEVVRIILRRFGPRLDESLERIIPERKRTMRNKKVSNPPKEKEKDVLESVIEESLKGIPYEKKKMFGCPAFFAQGTMFAGVYRHSIFIRLGEDERMRLAGVSGDIQPFEPLPGRIMRQYLAIPDSLCRKRALMKEWLNRSYAYALSLPPKEEKSIQARKKRP